MFSSFVCVLIQEGNTTHSHPYLGFPLISLYPMALFSIYPSVPPQPPFSYCVKINYMVALPTCHSTFSGVQVLKTHLLATEKATCIMPLVIASDGPVSVFVSILPGICPLTLSQGSSWKLRSHHYLHGRNVQEAEKDRHSLKLQDGFITPPGLRQGRDLSYFFSCFHF